MLLYLTLTVSDCYLIFLSSEIRIQLQTARELESDHKHIYEAGGGGGGGLEGGWETHRRKRRGRGHCAPPTPPNPPKSQCT